ncbi:MAG: hypothetical protein JWP29_4427, partial [Rhodoferax sp.]|nr:hypothetical protein [Rhodoferax sp.]
DTDVQLAQIVEALGLLDANGNLAAAQSADAAAATKPQVDQLNMHLLNQALGSGDVAHLACPVSGGAVALNRIEQLVLCASLDTPCQASDLAPRVWQVLASQGKKLLRDGQPLVTAADNLAELDRLAQLFVQARLPVLEALGVCPDLLPR